MTKLHTLSIRCISGSYLKQAYRFVLALPVESTLDELAACILDVVEFDGDHGSGFYVANTPGGKATWLQEDDFDAPSSDERAVRLCDIFPLGKNKKLYYLYDFGAAWRFEITRKGRETEAVAGQAYPLLVLEEGVRPDEYGDDEW